MCFVSKSNI
jgi:hypothetical protein